MSKMQSVAALGMCLALCSALAAAEAWLEATENESVAEDEGSEELVE